LSAKERERLRADLLDLALVWADLQVRLADAESKRQARRDALSLLKEADADLGPSPVLRLQRRELEAALVERPSAANDRVELWPKTAWECYAWGRIVLQQGNLEKADEMFRRAVDLDPGGFWPNFYLGLCALQRQDYPEAESAFRVCVSLAPESAVSHYNRGLALARLNRDEQAIAAFGRALHHDAKLGPAAFHRGVLLFHEKRYADAVADFERALECGHDPVAVCCQLALAHQALGQHARAVAAARQAHQADPADKTARKLLEQLTGK
jgi:eukaryotic-like serine/threonine-protein kinase